MQIFNFLSSTIKLLTSQGGELLLTDRSDLTESPFLHKPVAASRAACLPCSRGLDVVAVANGSWSVTLA